VLPPEFADSEHAHVSSGKRVRLQRSITRTSVRCTISVARTALDFVVMELLKGETLAARPCESRIRNRQCYRDGEQMQSHRAL
jgi:hypothetical protein